VGGAKRIKSIRRSQVTPPQPLISTSRTRNSVAHAAAIFSNINLDTVLIGFVWPTSSAGSTGRIDQHTLSLDGQGTKFCNQTYRRWFSHNRPWQVVANSALTFVKVTSPSMLQTLRTAVYGQVCGFEFVLVSNVNPQISSPDLEGEYASEPPTIDPQAQLVMSVNQLLKGRQEAASA